MVPKSPVGGPSRRPAQTPAGLPALDPAAGHIINQNFRPVVSEGHVSQGRGRSPPSPQHSLPAAPSWGPGPLSLPPQPLSSAQWWTPFRKLPPSALCSSHACWAPCVPGPGLDIDPRSGQARTSEGQTCWQVPTGSSSTCPALAATLSLRSGLIKGVSACVRGTLPGRAGARCLL